MYVLTFFQAQRRSRILAQELFDSTSEFANADLVRALEDLEKRERVLMHHTQEGNDYISLTPQGAASLGLKHVELDASSPMPHPPRSAT
jgi:hypothetical protein